MSITALTGLAHIIMAFHRTPHFPDTDTCDSSNSEVSNPMRHGSSFCLVTISDKQLRCLPGLREGPQLHR